MAILMVQRGDREKAHQLLDGARLRLGNKSFIRMYIESTEGEQDMQDGLLRQAAARFRIALGASHNSSQGMHDLVNGNAWSGVLYAVTCYEADRLEEAQRLLIAYLPVVRSMGWHEHQILTYVLLSRIARARGHEDQAEAYLTELEHAGMERHLPRLTATAWLERSRVETIIGNAETAAAALAKADLPTIWANDHKLRRLAHSNLDYRISNLRWTLQFGDARRALSEISSELAWSRSAKWPLRTMTYQILNAIGLGRLGQTKEASKLMREVLAFAAEQGFIRRILDEGPLALSLAQQILETEEVSDENPLIIDYLRRLLDGFQATERKTSITEPQEHEFSELTENLTPKEMQALKLIAEGHSNNAMAEKLGVSTSTIRTHLRNINSKLDVGSRMQAVAKARKLGLL
jgi:LuxR family maltose regulon positive regulatory protein